jgi:uncharacterized protein
MKKTTWALAITASVLFSCSKNEKSAEEINAAQIEQPSDLSKKCSFVDGNWSRTAQLVPVIDDSIQTFFMRGQNTKVAALWGRQEVLFRYVKDPKNRNSTFNAISYSDDGFTGGGKIYFGEAIYKAAKAKNPNNIVNVYILAHEFAHQLQFTFNLPSVRETTARPNELEADAMAGYYLRKPNGFNAGSFAEIASAYEFAYALGDNFITFPGHHGTAPQRRSAVRLGWLLADPALANLTAVDFDSNFFSYYNGVLAGTYRQVKPKGFNQKIDDLIKLHAEELRRIQSGEMTAEEFANLK